MSTLRPLTPDPCLSDELDPQAPGVCSRPRRLREVRQCWLCLPSGGIRCSSTRARQRQYLNCCDLMLQPCISDGGPPASRLELSSQEPFFYREIGYPVSALWRCVDVNSPVHLPSHIAVIYRRFSLDAAKTPCACIQSVCSPFPQRFVPPHGRTRMHRPRVRPQRGQERAVQPAGRTNASAANHWCRA